MDTLTRKSDEIIKHLTPTATILRCPVCGSSNVRPGITTVWGTPIFCMTCEVTTETRREG